MEQKTCWYLYCFNSGASSTWRFSTKELAEQVIEFFELDEDEYSLYEADIFDDEEFFNTVARFKKEEENENA